MDCFECVFGVRSYQVKGAGMCVRLNRPRRNKCDAKHLVHVNHMLEVDRMFMQPGLAQRTSLLLKTTYSSG